MTKKEKYTEDVRDILNEIAGTAECHMNGNGNIRKSVQNALLDIAENNLLDYLITHNLDVHYVPLSHQLGSKCIEASLYLINVVDELKDETKSTMRYNTFNDIFIGRLFGAMQYIFNELKPFLDKEIEDDEEAMPIDLGDDVKDEEPKMATVEISEDTVKDKFGIYEGEYKEVTVDIEIEAGTIMTQPIVITDPQGRPFRVIVKMLAKKGE